jgi:ATP-binding cassette subfamily B protein
LRPSDGDRLLVTVIRRAGGWLIPLVLLTALGAGATVLLPTVLGWAIDDAVTAALLGDDGGAGGGAAANDVHRSLLQTGALLGFIVLVQVISQLATGSGMAGATGRLRRDLVHRMLAAGPTPDAAGGDLVARLVGSTVQAARVVVLVASLAATLIPPVGGVVALALIDPWLAVTFAAGILAASGTVRTYLRESRAVTQGYLEAQGAIAGRLVDALTGARTIAAARTADGEIERVLEPLGELRRHGMSTWRNMARLAFKGEPVVLVTQVAVIAVAGVGLSADRLSPGDLVAASRYAVMAAGLGTVLDKLAALTRSRAATQRLAEVHARPVISYGTRQLPPGPGHLELRGVTAGTAGPEGKWILDRLDLVVPGGYVVALVGQSGAGKSLTAALAGRLCDPVEGRVWLDGVPLDELERRSLRRAITYAFERPSLLGGTVAEAIAFGVDRPPPDVIRDAARAARADGFVGRLPDGYRASLAGMPLSGGERQRLGLARALAHDARVLILDDATSSLDTATEAEIAAALTAQMHGRTRLIVTHRATTAARADLVAWLDGGRIRAYGPHGELWADPDYRAVFRPEPAAPPLAAAAGSAS